jgi:hypothetical protein
MCRYVYLKKYSLSSHPHPPSPGSNIRTIVLDSNLTFIGILKPYLENPKLWKAPPQAKTRLAAMTMSTSVLTKYVF